MEQSQLLYLVGSIYLCASFFIDGFQWFFVWSLGALHIFVSILFEFIILKKNLIGDK
jgi:hypothetical protein